MRVGYSYWGFLGDVKLDADGSELSTPDGNATYSWAFVYEMLRRGHQVHMMQVDRDAPAWGRLGDGTFAAFSCARRCEAYLGMSKTGGVGLPELDVLVLEWRFPIPGRNCPPTDVDVVLGTQGGYDQPDLDRQLQLLRHYSGTKTKVIVWDLDHKLTPDDELRWRPDAVFETSVVPRHQLVTRTRVEPPFVMSDLLQYTTKQADPMRKLVYIGSRYERDDVITEYVGPASEAYPGQVEFWGNWLNSLDECRALWPDVSFNRRVTTRDFRSVYATAVACPLLAKRSYIQTGFITPRPWEAVLFGTLPVGIAQMRGIREYTAHVVRDGAGMVELLYGLSQLTRAERHVLREEAAHMLRHMDARYLVDRVEEVAGGSDFVVPEEHNG